VTDETARRRTYRLAGRTVSPPEGRTRQELVCLREGELLEGSCWYGRSPEVRHYSSDGEMVALSAFGRMVYRNQDRDKIADQLIRLAGLIRREGK
jgi:hypothetical protein